MHAPSTNDAKSLTCRLLLGIGTDRGARAPFGAAASLTYKCPMLALMHLR
jgi:hypothetical protein